jgi:molecular chaperone HtpG
MREEKHHIKFEVETERILEILSNKIYDSPKALLRENVQNAYDAILMRVEAQGTALGDHEIRVTLEDGVLSVSDDGIGMDEDALREHFWKAGSSGKQGALALRAGVIGTFGIGAMANFGVCSSLRVTTRSIEAEYTVVSSANRADLKIAEECIEVERIADGRKPGTVIEAHLDDAMSLTLEDIKQYLDEYVRYLPVAVYVGAKLVSKNSLDERLKQKAEEYDDIASLDIDVDGMSAHINVRANANSQILVEIGNVQFDAVEVQGSAVLVQGAPRTFGYRSYFGLSPIPLSSQYELGGVVNLSCLRPTAGREALSRESIQQVNLLVAASERHITKAIAATGHADRNQSFIDYVAQSGLWSLAGKVTANVLPAGIGVPLEGLKEFEPHKSMLSYSGRDATVLERFATEQSNVVQVSQVRSRRKIQIQYLESLEIDEVPDKVIVEPVASADLNVDSAMVLVRVQKILIEDYSLSSAEMQLATISHGVSVHVEDGGERITVSVSERSPSWTMLVQGFRTARDVFDGIAKDFVREHLYPRLREYIPSSTRQGRDALLKRLRENRELFKYQEDDLGDMESVLAEYLAGKKSLSEVLVSSGYRLAGGQTQRVNREQVGSVEDEIPDIVGGADGGGAGVDELGPVPPIMRVDVRSDKKLLSVAAEHAKLNGFRQFLALSDRMCQVEGEFLHNAHTTRIMWGAHRIIYVFTDPTGSLSLYYDIELLEPLSSSDTGGRVVPTTTIVTGNRIFVPVPRELEAAFAIAEGEKAFYVRFDTIP